MSEHARCKRCGILLPHKDNRFIVLRTDFGAVKIASPRRWSCSCTRNPGTPRRTTSPLAQGCRRRDAGAAVPSGEVGRVPAVPAGHRVAQGTGVCGRCFFGLARFASEAGTAEPAAKCRMGRQGLPRYSCPPFAFGRLLPRRRMSARKRQVRPGRLARRHRERRPCRASCPQHQGSPILPPPRHEDQ